MRDCEGESRARAPPSPWASLELSRYLLAIKDSSFLRVGAAAGVLSAVVAIVFNAIHPRASSSALNDVAELLRLVGGSRSWRFVHLASVLATLLGTVAIVAVLWSMLLQGPGRWPVVAGVLLAFTTPILLLSVGLDGFAIKSVADRWVDAGPAEREGLLAAATALRSVDVAALNLVMIGQFGLTAIALGVASWSSSLYGRQAGLVAVIGGLLGVASGTLQALSGRLTTVSYLVLLTASLALFTVWLSLVSFMLWRKADSVSTARSVLVHA